MAVTFLPPAPCDWQVLQSLRLKRAASDLPRVRTAAEIEEEDALVAAFRARVEAAWGELEATIGPVKARIAVLEEELALLEADREGIMQDVVGLLGEHEHFSVALGIMRNAKDLETKLEEAGRERVRISTDHDREVAEVARLEAKITGLTSEVTDLRRQRTELSSDAAAWQQRVRELEDEKAHTARAHEGEIANLRRDVKTLNKKFKEAKADAVEWERRGRQAERESENARVGLQNARVEIGTLRAKNKHLEARVISGHVPDVGDTQVRDGSRHKLPCRGAYLPAWCLSPFTAPGAVDAGGRGAGGVGGRREGDLGRVRLPALQAQANYQGG
jgi:chromosome segregation ATPase